jgi:hypothetical protein
LAVADGRDRGARVEFELGRIRSITSGSTRPDIRPDDAGRRFPLFDPEGSKILLKRAWA